MRHLISASIVVALVACSGGSPTGTPPPPPPPGGPASITVVSGDGQSSAAGSQLPITLSVVVRDAGGAGVAGVVVHFTVDSGGGSLSAATATTGSDGVAVLGTWTLGNGVGITNVVRATVTGIAPVKFHAQASGPAARTLFSNQAVGTGGGTLRYTHTGDALDGLTLVIPPASYPSSVQWTIVADSSIAVPLPNGFAQVGPVLVITNGQDYSDSVMTLTMPMQVGAGMAVAPFYLDPTSGTLEGIPMVARTATSATLATRHFSGDFIAVPGKGAGLVRPSLRFGFGSVRVVWVKLPASQLAGTFTSTFQPGVDDWEFANYGDYISPGGDCEGMSITAMYYHYFFHPSASSGPGLYHQFDQSIANQWDNVQGIRFAGSVQGDYHARFAQGFKQVQTLLDRGIANGALAEDLTSMWVLLTLKLTGQPVLLSISGPIGGHAVVAYAASSTGAVTSVSVSDPNFPGNATRVMTFNSGVLVPFPLSLNATATPSNFIQAYALGVSAEVPLNQISSRWQEFVAHNAGADRYPPFYRFEIFDALNNKWTTLGSTFQSTSTYVYLQLVCPSCPDPLIFSQEHSQPVQLWNAAGSADLSFGGGPVTVMSTTPFLAVAKSNSPYDVGHNGFVDAQPFTFIRGTFFVLASATAPSVNTAVTFVNHHGGLAVPGATWTWDFDDGSLPLNVVIANDSTATHTFTHPGSFTVTVTLRDPDGTVRGVTSIIIDVQPPPTFTITPSPLIVSDGALATLTATAQGTVPANATYNWLFGDGLPGVTISGSPVVQHTWSKVGPSPVTLTVRDVTNTQVIAQATTSACVGTAWRFTSFTLSSQTPVGMPTDPSGPLYLAALANLYGYLDQVAATPSDGLLWLGDGTFFPEPGVYLQVAPPGTGAAGACWLFNGYLTQVARAFGVGSSYNNGGTLTTGGIDGAAFTTSTGVANSGGNRFNNTVHATKSGRSLTGTVSFGSNVYAGSRTYSFVATLVGQ